MAEQGGKYVTSEELKRYAERARKRPAMPRVPGVSPEAYPPQKVNVIKAARQLQAARVSQYNQGRLTPHDLAETIVEIWLEAVEMTR